MESRTFHLRRLSPRLGLRCSVPPSSVASLPAPVDLFIKVLTPSEAAPFGFPAVINDPCVKGEAR